VSEAQWLNIPGFSFRDSPLSMVAVDTVITVNPEQFWVKRFPLA
jgi:hypothetical protein